ncbi:MAG: homoserine kinase, partial [Chitinophagaceae bacterium]|nr:homoserine kinase [Chitinophagaceae bacterium]
MKKVRVHSPATVANLVCGFDILGMALSAPYDIMDLVLTEQPGIIIHNEDEFGLPTDPEKNVAGVVLLSVLEKIQQPIGFDLTI